METVLLWNAIYWNLFCSFVYTMTTNKKKKQKTKWIFFSYVHDFRKWIQQKRENCKKHIVFLKVVTLSHCKQIKYDTFQISCKAASRIIRHSIISELNDHLQSLKRDVQSKTAFHESSACSVLAKAAWFTAYCPSLCVARLWSYCKAVSCSDAMPRCESAVQFNRCNSDTNETLLWATLAHLEQKQSAFVELKIKVLFWPFCRRQRNTKFYVSHGGDASVNVNNMAVHAHICWFACSHLLHHVQIHWAVFHESERKRCIRLCQQ